MPAEDLSSLNMKPLAPGEGEVMQLPANHELAGLSIEKLLEMIDSNVGVFKTTGKPEELYSQAAEAVQRVVRLDSVCVLRWQDGQEECLAQVGTPKSVVTREGALKRVREGKTAFVSGESFSEASRVAIEIVAAAPLMNRNREVIGALYGERALRRGSPLAPVSRLEAILLQQLARELSLALDRLREEEEARRELSRMTSFMSHEQAQEVLTNPAWNAGRQVPVTILFCDIVGFTKITSEEADSLKILRWSGAVLQKLTQCVLDRKGTLIDYTGDGLSAMWGAPRHQDDPDELACLAAQDMIRALKPIDKVWMEQIGRETKLRIGINRGPVAAGNIGSDRFKKFGAHGNAVNIGKRVEGAAKHFLCPILVSHSSWSQLADVNSKFATRRLAQVEVEGFPGSFDVHELAAEPIDDAEGWRAAYQNALKYLETGIRDGNLERVRLAAQVLSDWRQKNNWDRPALMLLQRIINALAAENLKDIPVVLKLGK